MPASLMCRLHNTSTLGLGVVVFISKRVFERNLEKALEVFEGASLF